MAKRRGVGIVKAGASCRKGYKKIKRRMGKAGMRNICVLK